MDDPINFTYEDTDTLANEIAELYSYSEESEFFANRNAFEESMEDCGLPLTWKHMVLEQQTLAVNHLMTTLEVSCRTTRIKSCRALAYLIQGNFGECLTLEEQAENCRENVLLLYKQGIFQLFVQQLIIEANLSSRDGKPAIFSSQSSTMLYQESAELRLILSVLYTITEIMHKLKEASDDEKALEMRQQFVKELQNPIGDELLSVSLFQMLNSFCSGQAPHYPVKKITLLLWKIILITLGGFQELKNLKEKNRKMCNLAPAAEDTMEVVKNMTPCSPPMMPDGQARPRTTFSNMANRRRVLKQPAFSDLVFAYAKETLLSAIMMNYDDNEGPTKSNTNEELNDRNERDDEDEMTADRLTADEASALLSAFGDGTKSDDSGISAEAEAEAEVDSDCEKTTIDDDEPHVSKPESSESDIFEIENIDQSDVDVDMDDRRVRPDGSPPDNVGQLSTLSFLQVRRGSQADFNRSDANTIYRGLPWTPKVRKADLSAHLQNIRLKFLGFVLPDDVHSTAGLPEPIVEGINVLRRHLYVSLSEVQLEREDAIHKYPLTHSELNPDYCEEPAEKLYSALLPRLPQHMIALLKILLAASTLNSKNKSDRVESINIMAEINPDVSSQSIIQTLKMNVDAIRHKEIIIKSISAILILLLKHFKVNHVYQFEYVSQQLMFANCIPLILKFLSQDMSAYIVTPRSTISAIDFPACVIGEQPELTTDAIELCSFQPYCWRNMFSCINLVRVLNKLTKWKHSRIMMLVVFKSSQTLLKALIARQPMFQLYVLKLLKVQLKFLGRQWKKSNMKLISPIYQKVRHRLTDDWAYSNDNEARPWDFQAEEFTLQANINRFHQRRYHDLLTSGVGSRARTSSMVFDRCDKFGGYDDCVDDDYNFGSDNIVQISPYFEKNYDKWLEREVFERKIDWEKLLDV